MTRLLAPQTHTLPICRATSAACDETPPRAVRMPSAAIMPRRSSGLVSTRTSTTFSPRWAISTASSALNTILPLAAPGPAGRPLPMTFAPLADARSKIGARIWLRLSAGMRLTASSLVMNFSFTISHGDADGGHAGALAVAGLEDVEAVVLDGELQVLHVAEMLLQRVAHLEQLLVAGGHLLGELRHRLRRADAGDHVLALGVDEVLAVEHLFARGRVAGERDARGAGVAHVAEDHRLHVDRRAPLGRDAVLAAVDDGAVVHPRAEHGADGAFELFARVLREALAGALLDEVLERLDELLERRRRSSVAVQLDARRRA